MAEPSTHVVPDPRRRGRLMLAVLPCWCGRSYTLTREEADRRRAEGRHLCPDPTCGQGAK